MAGIAWYVGTAALTAGAFAAGRAAAGRNRKWALGAAAVALLVLILKAALNRYPVLEARLFPWTWYVYLQGYWLWPVTLLFFGLTVRQLPVRWNRAVVTSVAAIMFALSLYFARWMVSPIDHSSSARADAAGHCRQTTGYTCTPASCVAVLAWWGIETTEGEMARLCLTSSWGTTAFNAYRGLTLKLHEVAGAGGPDLQVRMIAWDPGALRRLGVPAVVTGSPHHAVAVRFEGGTFVVHDPMAFQSYTYASPPEHITGPAVVIVQREREPSTALGRTVVEGDGARESGAASEGGGR
ncbi:MAG: cysteine peptidase family C39 domain-containing protein [Planctomycetota bacterium]|jgi:hypothetical protein